MSLIYFTTWNSSHFSFIDVELPHLEWETPVALHRANRRLTALPRLNTCLSIPHPNRSFFSRRESQRYPWPRSSTSTATYYLFQLTKTVISHAEGVGGLRDSPHPANYSSVPEGSVIMKMVNDVQSNQPWDQKKEDPISEKKEYIYIYRFPVSWWLSSREVQAPCAQGLIPSPSQQKDIAWPFHKSWGESLK